jgi:hypothetical protein
MLFKVMNTTFTEINGQEVKEAFPEFYHETGRFFEIIHKEQPMGFVAIGKLNAEDCVLGLFVFQEYRNALSKSFVFSVLDLPGRLNFKRCVMMTTKKTILKLFRKMRKYGIFEHGIINHEPTFIKETHGFYS